MQSDLKVRAKPTLFKQTGSCFDTTNIQTIKVRDPPLCLEPRNHRQPLRQNDAVERRKGKQDCCDPGRLHEHVRKVFLGHRAEHDVGRRNQVG